jgi:hypothetical protein
VNSLDGRKNRVVFFFNSFYLSFFILRVVFESVDLFEIGESTVNQIDHVRLTRCLELGEKYRSAAVLRREACENLLLVQIALFPAHRKRNGDRFVGEYNAFFSLRRGGENGKYQRDTGKNSHACGKKALIICHLQPPYTKKNP